MSREVGGVLDRKYIYHFLGRYKRRAKPVVRVQNIDSGAMDGRVIADSLPCFNGTSSVYVCIR